MNRQQRRQAKRQRAWAALRSKDDRPVRDKAFGTWLLRRERRELAMVAAGRGVKG